MHETKPSIPGRRSFILGINEKPNATRLSMNALCPRQRIHQHQLAQPPVLKFNIHREAPQPDTGYAARQPLPYVPGKVAFIQPVRLSA